MFSQKLSVIDSSKANYSDVQKQRSFIALLFTAVDLQH